MNIIVVRLNFYKLYNLLNIKEVRWNRLEYPDIHFGDECYCSHHFKRLS